MGGSWSTWKKPKQALGEHANFLQIQKHVHHINVRPCPHVSGYMSGHQKVHDLARESSVLPAKTSSPSPHLLPPLLSPAPPACPPVWLGSRLEQSARCCELERHFNNISAIRTLHRSHCRAPPQPRGVNSRSQIRRPARLIHHPISFVGSFFISHSLSVCLTP